MCGRNLSKRCILFWELAKKSIKCRSPPLLVLQKQQNERRFFLKRINLRELYPDYYQTDIFIDIPEEVLAVITEETRAEASAKRKTYRYRAQYSLDVKDGIENAMLQRPTDPEIILENHQQCEELRAAVMSLPKKQAKRICARFFLGLTIKEIAQIEGVSKSRVSESIRTGLKKIKKFFK